MAQFTTYCEAVRNGRFDEKHRHYHDHEYGFPIEEDNALFGRLILEINQAGLSWDTILNKRERIRIAYANFDVSTIAAYREKDIQRLLQNTGVIRMRKKIEAIIYNAQQIEKIQKEYGSFSVWQDIQDIENESFWVQLFKKHFKFTGSEITKEFVRATGYIEGAHERHCPIYKTILKKRPKWLKA